MDGISNKNDHTAASEPAGVISRSLWKIVKHIPLEFLSFFEERESRNNFVTGFVKEYDENPKFRNQALREISSLPAFHSVSSVNPLKPTGHVIHQQFNIQQLHALPTLYLCVLYLSENKQRLVSLTAWTDWFL